MTAYVASDLAATGRVANQRRFFEVEGRRTASRPRHQDQVNADLLAFIKA
jgi:hypothetical protein